MSQAICSECGGRCCRGGLGYRIPHMGEESYQHWCEACDEGFVVGPDPALIALRSRCAELERRISELEAEIITLKSMRPL